MSTGRRADELCDDEERNWRHCRDGCWTSWKLLSSALDGAIDRDILMRIRTETWMVPNLKLGGVAIAKATDPPTAAMQLPPAEAGWCTDQA